MNKWLYILHGWIGLNFGLVLFVVCLSGTIAVVSHEIDWLCNPAIRVTPADTQTDWTTRYEAVQRAYPDLRIRSAFAPIGSRFACEFWVDTDSGVMKRVYVDPYRGNVTGHAPWFNTQRFFRDFHRRFFWFAWWGIWVVTIFAFVLLVSAGTGLAFYKRWWTKLFVLRIGLGSRVFFSDLHRLFGVWTLLFTILIAGTGVWYFVEIPLSWVYRGKARPSSAMPAPPLPSEEIRSDRLAVSELAKIAEQAIPEFEIRSISFPKESNKPVQFQGQASAWLVRNRANKVLVDPYDGKVLLQQQAEDLRPLARWVDTVDPLHFGNFGGLTTKLIWFVFGLGLSTLMPTGTYLWIRRRSQIAEGIARRIQTDDTYHKNEHTTIRRQTRRRITLGLISTTATWLLAAYATWDVLADQLTEYGPTYGWRALGEPAVVAFYGSFLLIITAATFVWYRWVWFYVPPNTLPAIQRQCI